ncbi:uncharacterized protein N7479_008615 [Penicillium vulpinum]|uniref:Uncharacterized protein n=1 Tax=Penicillium vulpinum TaxID=29845 RepID=A0A1V6R261_9EURO|nr:uncharacterized protein N7479_008615 [Penicillium vulpinum]KAJ5950202.1 hypothetical protein N7479_008615 [Penicillium vulpinum]OQD95533.1 hypothetical protein PENVUL_c113G10380 [Penicillium vulpinum]
MDSSQSIREVCAVPDSLFARSDEELIQLVYKQFPGEIDRLRRAYSIRDSPWTPPSTPSPSYILYNENSDEANRTLVGLLALRWIHTGQYETFIGKDPQLASDCCAKTGVDISTLNHDAILLAACKAGIVPSLDQLPDQDRDDVLRAIELDATFNFGQLAQAENAPACLSSLPRMKGHDRSFRLRFMEQLLDIAGAAGHMDWTGAKKLVQPIFESYRNVYDVCDGVIAGTLTVRSGYDLILIRRAKFLCDKGVRQFQMEQNPEDQALMRLFCMGNMTTQEKALLYEDAWRALEDPVRETLANALNLDGRRSEPAVQPTYMPALLCRIRDVNALVCTLHYLAQVMSTTDIEDPSAVVIERSVYSVLKQFVESDEFKQDPTILERVEVPEGVVALTTVLL